jgi:hypothetical protein
MHPRTIFAKTPKGVLEVRNKTIRLPRDLGLLFLAVDGKCPVSELPQKAEMDASSLTEALERLVADGYIRISYQPPEAGQAAAEAGDLDLDFTSPEVAARLENEARERTRAEAEAKARADAAARALLRPPKRAKKPRPRRARQLKLKRSWRPKPRRALKPQRRQRRRNAPVRKRN